ncbi:hypothetical protein IEQ34_008503 [Dendrobium chrysotoxum]|uniref:Uncharacterized protein n=1 Tax=Dendrobium chrysotoxum TaxID=161865 RepID=A0AAV7GZF8_DENCH|nr:hypothetical protein IEQ34_008503 [Dendrobium chrysotoxum]
MCPAPTAKMLARSRVFDASSIIGPPLRSTIKVVVMIADLIAAGDQSGCNFFNSAATPDTCGAAMEVPLSMVKFFMLLDTS